MTSALAGPESSPSPWPSGWARLVILAAVVLSTVRLIETEPLQSANDRSRWTTVWSLVERGTWQIDEIIQSPGWDTIDKVRHEGHFYSSKPPLLSAIVAGLYWLVKQTLGWSLVPGDLAATAWVTQLVLWFVNILPTAVALECLGRVVWRHTSDRFARALILVAGCFGTLWPAYLPSLNNHTPALCCVLFAMAAVATDPGHSTSPWRLALAGFFAAFATVFELPAAAFLGLLGLWLFRKNPRRTLLFFATAAAVPLAAHFLTNYFATGGWRPFYADYGTEKYRYVFEGIPSYWLDPKGVDKARDSLGRYFFHCTIGHHGLFSLTPLLLLSAVGALRIGRWRSTALAPIHAMGIALSIIVFGFYLSRPENFNYGGVSVGLRWMLWLIPFWLLLLIPACEGLSARAMFRGFAAILLAGSVFSGWHPFDAPWRQPWLFERMQAKGWIDYRDPAPQFGHTMRSWIVELPAGDAKQDDYWVELSGTAVDGSAITLRLADDGPVLVGDRAGRGIAFTWNSGRSSERRQTIVVDRERFLKGDEIAACLLWPNGPPDAAAVAEAAELVQGLPSPQAYRCAAQRYVKLPLRTDAFRCLIGAAAAGRQSTAPGIREVAIRSEFWTSPEIPFGVVLWDIQTSNLNTSAPLARRRLTVASVGRLVEPPQ